MPKRNFPLESGTCYWVQKPNGKHYKVWSKEVLQARIERGEITSDHQVKIQRIYT
jgi:hypothetical protein